MEEYFEIALGLVISVGYMGIEGGSKGKGPIPLQLGLTISMGILSDRL